MKTLLQMFLLAFLLSACEEVKLVTEDKYDEKEIKAPNWDYSSENGPEHWAELIPHTHCTGNFQSPINIVSIDAELNKKGSPLEVFYAKNTHIHDVANNGHTIQYNFEAGDYVTYKDKKFELKQFHFHGAAEHTINGIRYPMEMHMVHIDESGEYLVIAIMVKEGKSSETFDFLETYLPLAIGEIKKIDKSFDLNLNFPKSKKYFYYNGSLTTPPCTEHVNWFVFNDPITISETQVNMIKSEMPEDNYRTLSPLNDRVVTTNE